MDVEREPVEWDIEDRTPIKFAPQMEWPHESSLRRKKEEEKKEKERKKYLARKERYASRALAAEAKKRGAFY